MHPPATITPLSEQCALVQWPQVIDVDINSAVMALHHAINRQPFTGFSETAPAYASLAVYYNVMEIRYHHQQAFEFVKQQILERLQLSATDAVHDAAAVEIPVRYGGSDGPDAAEVASMNGITLPELIQLHTGTTYQVFMMGFMPGFPYMGITHEKLEVARRAQPRAQVPAGSVGLAGRQTGIYPFASPGGWQIIGQTDTVLFDAEKCPHCLVQPGMQVRFVAV